MKNKVWRTAISRRTISAPAKFLWKQDLIEGKVLDYGCGKGRDVVDLQEIGFDITGYDPFHIPWNKPVKSKYDTILCTYVLNVVDRQTRATIIRNIQRLLRPEGKAYITVRRDIKKEGLTKRNTYQFNVELPFKKIEENSNYCIYEAF